MGVSTLRPVAQHLSTKSKMTTLSFAPGGAPVVVVGSDTGGMLAFYLSNVMFEKGEGREAQLVRLEEALRANTMKGLQPPGPGGEGAGGQGAAAGPGGSD